LIVCVIYGLAYLLAALAPTLEGDSLAGYLVLPREYARNHAMVAVDYAYGTIFPQNGQLVAALGFLLQGQILAQLLVVWLPGLVALAALYTFTRTWLSRRAALIAMAAWYGMASVGYLAASAKVDLAWAAFDLLSLVAFGRWYFARPHERHWRWLVLAGFFLGVAGGVKQASLFTAVALSIAMAVRLWQDGQRRPGAWITAYLALGVPAAMAAAWALRTYLMAGILAFTAAEFRDESGAIGFFRTLWQMSMLGNAVSVEGPVGKSIGPTILATVPLLALVRTADRRVWQIAAFCGLMLVLWFTGVQRARHLLPTLALLSLLAGHVITLLLAQRPRLGQVLVVLMLISLGINFATWSHTNFVAFPRLGYILGLQNLEGYLATNLPRMPWHPNYAMVAYARDRLPASARIAGLTTVNSYYLSRPFYANWTHTPVEMPNAADYAASMRAARITHVLINDYDVRTWRLQSSWLLQPDFHTRYLRKLFCADAQCLYEVASPPSRPVPASPSPSARLCQPAREAVR
jgi:hypothetical protein